MLASLGLYDPQSESTRDTPARLVKALQEMTCGYAEIESRFLDKSFESQSDEIVIVRGIRFVSLCEHHVLPFVGTAAVGYIPSGRIVGLSKIPRLVEALSRRLQVQEELTSEIAQAMFRHPTLNPKGVAVFLKAKHSCMAMRGVRAEGGEMITSAMLGLFRSKPAARAEFFSLIK